MGRLEDIVERNRNPKGRRERWVWGIVIGSFILIILGLMVFTDLGKPKEPPQAPATDPKAPHVDDVKLWKPRPASPDKK